VGIGIGESEQISSLHTEKPCKRPKGTLKDCISSLTDGLRLLHSEKWF